MRTIPKTPPEGARPHPERARPQSADASLLGGGLFLFFTGNATDSTFTKMLMLLYSYDEARLYPG